MSIRANRADELDAILSLHRAAFPAEESASIVMLVEAMLGKPETPPVLSLVAEANGQLAGHVVFSPISLDSADDGYILAPLAVSPALQRSGLGTQLVNAGLAQLKAAGVSLVLVYGDPAYYGRFGFTAEAAEPYRAPYPLQYPFGWQALLLSATTPPAAPVVIRCVDALNNPALW
ncbi:GNAT family N-acetyltransferase [Motiliproteus sediminis]|uniref:GNAT family N-acetyltransferase n=1 Tax=Motiliproteus sediminis TaxID=1468178 RepID=UPI001AEF638C|nr:N-acetyltransferase [Motiliproteus sediminis]